MSLRVCELLRQKGVKPEWWVYLGASHHQRNPNTRRWKNGLEKAMSTPHQGKDIIGKCAIVIGNGW